jgi:hypothetical protein
LGTYLRTVVEVRDADGWKANTKNVFTNDITWPGHSAEPLTHKAFFWQSYTTYSLLAGVCVRYFGITPVAPGRDLPEDADEYSLVELLGDWDTYGLSPMSVADKQRNRHDTDLFGFSRVTAAELLAVDYDTQISTIDEPSCVRSLRSELGDRFFQHLNQLSDLGAPEDVRVLFRFS